MEKLAPPQSQRRKAQQSEPNVSGLGRLKSEISLWQGKFIVDHKHGARSHRSRPSAQRKCEAGPAYELNFENLKRLL